MNKRMGITRLGQQGITIFEVSIITLVVILIAVSTWIIVSKVNHKSQADYDKYNDVKLMNPSGN